LFEPRAIGASLGILASEISNRQFSMGALFLVLLALAPKLRRGHAFILFIYYCFNYLAFQFTKFFQSIYFPWLTLQACLPDEALA